jgi:hypothetical protein
MPRQDKTVGCGDSGNDIAMFEGENLSIVVGNAQEDLVKWLDANVANYTGNGGNNGQPPRYVTLDDDDHKPVWLAWAVGALFRGVSRIHINHVYFHVCHYWSLCGVYCQTPMSYYWSHLKL